ncbi:MFS transporter [Kitasatospora griseola]|uniref:MFS transporter n=1 Tax=Kitasatospora griseola TaxID=2064 RepID=UPI0036DA4926
MSTDAAERPKPGFLGFLAQLAGEDSLRRSLVAVRFAAATGKGVLLSGSVVYFTLHVHLAAAQIGFGLTAAGIASLVSSVLFGMVADRMPRRLLLFINFVVIAVGFGLYAAIDNAYEFYVVAMVISFFDTGLGPTEGAMIASLIPDGERVRLNAMMRTVFNIGFSAGIGIAALAAASRHLLMLIPFGSAALLGLAALLVLRLPKDGPRKPIVRRRRFGAIRDLPYVGVVGLSSVLSSHMTLLMVVLPLWTLHRTTVPHFVVPMFLVINTVFVILFQVRASKGAETVLGAARTARIAGVWIAAGCAAVGATVFVHQTVVGIVAIMAAVLAMSMAEITQSASAWGLAFGLAPEHAKAEYLGTFDLHIGTQNVVGPVILAGLVISGGLWGWGLIAAAVLLAAWLIVPAARRSAVAMAALAAHHNEFAEKAETV